MNIKVKKLDPRAIVPMYAHADDAGMDVFALDDVAVPASGRVSVRTGISVAVPDGYAALVWDKSSIAFRDGLKVIGGVIDSGYRGEVLIGVFNMNQEEVQVQAGQKITQILIQKVEQPDIVLVDELDESDRGGGGFGSTGKF